MVYILWDNIPRGTQVNSQHIERSCTADFLDDRKLGVSEMVRVAAATFHILTGVNISAVGELASRALEVRLDTSALDVEPKFLSQPENRPVKHSDPVRWTEDHRAKIMKALYTILLGNPMLDEKPDATCKTRFKTWWRLVGSAIEHAANLVAPELAEAEFHKDIVAGKISTADITNKVVEEYLAKYKVNFEDIFVSKEETGDEETVSLTDVLEKILVEWPEGFLATDISLMVNTCDAAPLKLPLRGFLFPNNPSNESISPRSVGKRLQEYIDSPVRSGEDRVLILRSRKEGNNPLKYWVEVKTTKTSAAAPTQSPKPNGGDVARERDPIFLSPENDLDREFAALPGLMDKMITPNGPTALSAMHRIDGVTGCTGTAGAA